MSASRYTRDAEARAILGPELLNFLTAIYGYEDGTYPEELLRTAAVIIQLPWPGKRTLPLGPESSHEVELIIGEYFEGTYEEAAHAIRKWAATFKTDRTRMN